MRSTLLILAAGIGSRYGGTKQLDPVGPNGEVIFDYTAYDALQAGFSKVVLVIRRESEQAVREHIAGGLGRRAEVRLAFQDLDDLPAGFSLPKERTKPWGTAHAVLAAADELEGPFAVANADDYYGRDSFVALHRFLAADPSDQPPWPWCMVGYELGKTLPESGSVSRGLCQRDSDGRLSGIHEITSIWRDGKGARWRDEDDCEHVVANDKLVSMNLWGFTTEALDFLGRRFVAFLSDAPGPRDEFFLPVAVGEAIATGAATVDVLTSAERWCGLTSPADRETVVAMLAELVAQGRYPEDLWS